MVTPGLQTKVPQPNRGGWGPGLAVLLFVALVVWLVVALTKPSAPQPASVPKTDFSSARAMADMKTLTEEVRVAGMAGHDKTRDQLMDEIRSMGLTPELQSTVGLRRTKDVTFDRMATVENILVRIKGTEGGKAVLLATHYSTALHSEGADDAVGVAALLETMRNLQAGAPQKHDVIFLLTDAKEPYPIGSAAFVEQHPWAKEVGVSFNFDSRGSHGPVFMYETSEQNSGLIAGLAQAIPSPFANSMLYSLYKLTYYDTDFTLLKDISGSQGLNFAFANGSAQYHNPSDNLAHVDEASLQQMGEYALGLARYFGNAPTPATSSGDAVFFNLINGVFVHYPVSWVIPIDVVVALVMIAALAYGFRQKKLTAGRLLLGFLMFLLMVIAALALTVLGTLVIGKAADSYALVTHGALFMIGFLALTLAAFGTLYALVSRKMGVYNLTAGGLFGWFLLLAAVTVLVPAGSYLFAWPLLFSSLALFALLRIEERNTWARVLALCLLGLPTLLLGAQFAYLVYMLMTLSQPAVVVALVALIGGLLLPHLDAMIAPRRFVLPIASGIAAVALLVTGCAIPSYDADHPKWDILFYGYDADSGKGYFGSEQAAPDAFTGQYLHDWTLGNFAPFFPASLDPLKIFVKGPAPSVAAPAPKLTVIDDQVTSSSRELHVKITSEKAPWNTLIEMTSDQPLTTVIVNGKSLVNQDPVKNRWEIMYYAPKAEGTDLTLHLLPKQGVKFHLVDGIDGLPQELHLQRPANLVPNYFSDITYVAKTYAVAPK